MSSGNMSNSISSSFFRPGHSPRQPHRFGLFAKADIPAGTRILAEKPVVVRDDATDDDEAIKAKVMALPEDKRKIFLDYPNRFATNTGHDTKIIDIFAANAMPLGPGPTELSGVFPIAVHLINHDCNPNTLQYWHHENGGFMSFHALRRIKAGEEITISYINLWNPAAKRRKKLRERFNFFCECGVCTLPPEALQRNDECRQDMKDLLKYSIARGGWMDYGERLAACQKFTDRVREAFGQTPDILMWLGHNAAYQVCIFRGDLARASVFAERELMSRMIGLGDSCDTVEQCRRRLKNPQDDPAYGRIDLKWKSAKGDIPKGLYGDKFEKWLFAVPFE